MSLPTVFQLASLVFVIMILVCTLTVAKLKKYKLWELPLWKWEILVAVIISGHLVSGCVVRIVAFSLERTFLSNGEVLYFVYGMKKAVQHCIWLALIVIAWHYLVAEKMAKETHNKVLSCTSNILLCLLVGSLVWLVKVLIVKLLASSFHHKNFFGRVHLFNQYTLKMLRRKLQEESKGKDEPRRKAEKQKLPQLLTGFSRKLDQKSLNVQKNKRKRLARSFTTLINLFDSGILSSLSTLDEFLPDSRDDEDKVSLENDAKKE